MDELAGRLATRAGIDSVVAENIGIALGFLRNGGLSDHIQALTDRISGAEAAITASSSNSGFSPLLGGGLMAVGAGLQTPGRGMSENQGTARELLGFGRDKIGADHMGGIISGTPGLGQFAY